MGCFYDHPYPEPSFLAFLWKLYNNHFCDFVRRQDDRQSYYAVVGIIINTFHFIVLTRKSMKTSTIYIMMAAIAILDIGCNWYSVHRQLVRIIKVFKICYSKDLDYVLVFLRIFLDNSRNYTRRCSTWLSFLITLFRTLIIRYPLNQKFDVLSKPKSAYYSIFIVCFLSALVHIVDFYRYDIFPQENPECNQWTLHEYWWYQDSEFYTDNDYFVAKVHHIADGLVSRIIPCILFIVATFFLIKAIRDAEKQNREMNSNQNSKKSRNTSNLVLALTISFFIAGFPMGVISLLSPFSPSDKSPDDGFLLYVLLQTFDDLFSIVFILTTVSHMVICIFMSSQYRDTAVIILTCGLSSKAKKQGNSLTASSRI